ncbi:HMG domain-containing protein 3 [Merluccius polli]|uniref:HMG domain-containing protein 3 n=1 Tax=Merluccius polli TaxID=89951 RepID=A0AA47NSZ5_MERPO|nr:HMG domain-containing protein 3 [Merluccius polli]
MKAVFINCISCIFLLSEFTIIKCGLGCRKKTHFHCYNCAITIINRQQVLKHLESHNTAEAPPVTPVAPPVRHVTPVAPPERHVAPLVTPVATPVTPVAPPVTPVAPPVTPVAPPERHVAPLVTPVATPVTPVAPPVTPVAHPVTPVAPPVTPEAPPVTPEAPPVTPVAPPVTPEAPPVTPVATPVMPVATPVTPVAPPVTPVAPPERHVAPLVTPVTPAVRQVPPVRQTSKVTCSHCNLQLNRKNYKTHIRRKHVDSFEVVSKERHLACQCIDPKNGVFAVEKSFHGPATPIHVIKKTWGPTQKIVCELNQCQLNAEFAVRSRILPFECHHLRSLSYCPRSESKVPVLSEESLVEMVQNKWFGEERKASLIQRQKEADAEAKYHISVYEPKVSYYSRLQRTIIAYDSKKNSWHCPCAKPKQSCEHPAIGKWHLFETKRYLFRRLKSTDSEGTLPPQLTSEQDGSQREEGNYPPRDKGVERMLKYIAANKKLPAEIPQALIQQSRDAHVLNGYPRHLIPKETRCMECDCMLSDPVLITSKGRILSANSVIEGISTYRRVCLNCSMVYRYKEWEDGVHNFDDHLILSLHLCLSLRNAIQTHTAVSRLLDTFEATEKMSFPNKDRVLQAYLHFEALTDHEYMYACISCGYNPSVIVMDLHKKGVFNMPVSDIESPPDNYDGHVDIEQFWDAVTREMLSRGLIPCQKNPFVVAPSYHHWAPWIGPQTRCSAHVLNTEFEKLHTPKLLSTEADDQLITEERLVDKVLNLKVEEVRALCKACGLDNKGSKTDLVVQLQQKMSNRVTYNKVFQKVWGASGGLAVITCPCGVVYSVKFNLRAESPRDYVDMLLSWKHFPNISVYDYARGLAVHANRRQPDTFEPFQGRLLEPTVENIKQASDGKLKVHMPWLKNPKVPEDKNGHPLTGSSEHYALCDVFYQSNSQDPSDVLRKIGLVPELVGQINSQCVEQLFSGMRKNNYFLNMTSPSNHIFLQRNILHHHNVARNQKTKEEFCKIVPANTEMQLDSHGKMMVPPPQPVLCTMSSSRSNNSEELQTSTDDSELDDFTSLQKITASRACWGQELLDIQTQQLEDIIDKNRSPTEHIAYVNNLVLSRSDFWSIGLGSEVNGMVTIQNTMF